jgi:hypothetical protein
VKNSPGGRRELHELLAQCGSREGSPPISEGGRSLQRHCPKCGGFDTVIVGQTHFHCSNVACTFRGTRETLLEIIRAGRNPKRRKAG